MLMSILSAVTFSFTACTDDEIEKQDAFQQAQGNGPSELLEAYGLTWHNFDGDANAVQILDNDTTEISVSKKLADKLGITSFVNHPLGIWQAVDELPYARKAVEQNLVGDTYILKVVPATVAELIGDKQAQLNTDIYVDDNQESVKTRAANDNMPEFAAKYVDNADIVHPSVIYLTDPYGYDQEVHYPGDPVDAKQTRAAQNGNYMYMTADEIAKGNTRWNAHRRILSAKTEISMDEKSNSLLAKSETINFAGRVPIEFDLNYFITLNGGFGFTRGVYLKKFEAGLDGRFAFSPEATISFSKSLEWPEKKQKRTLATFSSYTFTFMVGPVPVLIVCKPALYLKFTGKVEGKAQLGLKYDYENTFKGGIRYEDGKGVSLIREFKDEKDEFRFIEPEAELSVNASVGLYLGVEVKIYDVAGPEAGVGPRLSAEAKYTRSLVDKSKSDFTAEVKGSIYGFAGAKIEILGWKLAEISKEIEFLGSVTLAKYPSDGSEYKTPNGKKLDEMRSVWDEKMRDAAKKNGNNKLREKFDTAVDMFMVANDESESFAQMEMYREFDNNCKAMLQDGTSENDLYKKMESVIDERIKFLTPTYQGALDYKIRKDVWEQLQEQYNLPDWNDKKIGAMIDSAFRQFRNEYNREPNTQKPEDMNFLMSLIAIHQPNIADNGTESIKGESFRNLLDSNRENKWFGGWNGRQKGIEGDDVWFVEFHSIAPRPVEHYILHTAKDTCKYRDRNPKNFKLWAKESVNSNWVLISDEHDVCLPVEFGGHKEFTVNSNAKGKNFMYFRFEVSETRCESMQLAYLAL